MWGEVSKTLSWPMIKPVLRRLRCLGQVLAHQAHGVSIGATLLSAVGLNKVSLAAQLLTNPGVVSEFDTVIRGDGSDLGPCDNLSHIRKPIA